jgi:hypothetical protein
MFRFLCPCGKKLKVSESMVGKVVECPQCHTKLEVPAPDGAAESPPDATEEAAGGPADEGLNDLLNAVKSGPAVKPSGGSRPAPGRAPAAGGRAAGGRPSAMNVMSRRPGAQAHSNMGVFIGLGVAVGIFVMVGLVMWLAGGPSQPEKKEPEHAAPPVQYTPPPKTTTTVGDLFPGIKAEDPSKSGAPKTPAATPSAAPAATTGSAAPAKS